MPWLLPPLVVLVFLVFILLLLLLLPLFLLLIQLRKTERSTNELAIDMNCKYDWQSLTAGAADQQQQLLQQRGPGRVGLQNLGNTCYANAVLQVSRQGAAGTARWIYAEMRVHRERENNEGEIARQSDTC